MDKHSKKIWGAAIACLLILISPGVHAACTSPAAPNGAMQVVSGVWKQCNSSDQWVAIDASSTGVTCMGQRVTWTESTRTCNADVFSAPSGAVQTAVDPNNAAQCSSVHCGTAVYTCNANGTWSMSSPDCNSCSGGGCCGCGDDNDEAADDLIWGAVGQDAVRALIREGRKDGRIH